MYDFSIGKGPTEKSNAAFVGAAVFFLLLLILGIAGDNIENQGLVVLGIIGVSLFVAYAVDRIDPN